VITCTKCGNSAGSTDLVCPVCGGFLAGTQDEATLIVGAAEGNTEESDFFVLADEAMELQAGVPAQSVKQSWWPLVSRVAIATFYIAFVLAVAFGVNWMLRKL
jgi:hypothetical protein